MILVNCVWIQDEIIRRIEEIEYKGIHVFKHIKSDGMRMYFDCIAEKQVLELRSPSILEYQLIMGAIMKIEGWMALAISIVPVINESTFEGYKYTT